MMTLPDFKNPNITIDELLAEQKRLHKQADKMLTETSLIDLFSRYGELQPIGGSYAYGLMVYPDLDMGVRTDKATTKDFVELVSEVAASDFVRGFSAADRVRFTPLNPDRPKGYWVGLDVPFEGERWGIDLWIQTREWDQGQEDRYNKKLARLTQEQTAAILSIKYHLIREGLYGKDPFRSIHVYDAVIDKGVRSYDDFLSKTPGVDQWPTEVI